MKNIHVNNYINDNSISFDTKAKALRLCYRKSIKRGSEDRIKVEITAHYLKPAVEQVLERMANHPHHDSKLTTTLFLKPASFVIHKLPSKIVGPVVVEPRYPYPGAGDIYIEEVN